MKNDRLKIISEMIIKISKLRNLYIPETPARIMLDLSYNCIYSLYHLENSENFDDKILGVKDE